MLRLADHLEAIDAPPPPSLRHTLYGGAPMGHDDLRRVHERVGPSLCQLYGRFEAAGRSPYSRRTTTGRSWRALPQSPAAAVGRSVRSTSSYARYRTTPSRDT